MDSNLIAIIIAISSLLFTYFATNAARKQADEAEKARLLTIQFTKSDATIHFTDRFFELLKEVKSHGIEQHILSDRTWAYQFWSLQSTEFYFFHHGILPTFMYSLWMVDLAQMYAGENGEEIRASHNAYLKVYSLNYDAMSNFFEHLFQLAKTYSDQTMRNEAITTWVITWIIENRRNAFE